MPIPIDIWVPRIPKSRETLEQCLELAREIALNMGADGEPVLTKEITDERDSFSRMANPQGWRFRWKLEDT